jgi:hypothetical protein
MDPSYAVYGESPFGLHVGVLLRGGSAAPTTTDLPTTLAVSGFLVKRFVISDDKSMLFGAVSGLPPPSVKVFVHGELTCVSVATGLPSV